MFNYIALNRLDEAKAAYGQALERKLHHPFFPLDLYHIAFLQNDAAGMAQQVAWSVGQPGVEDELLAWKPIQLPTLGGLGRLENFPARRSIPPNGQKRRKSPQRTLPCLALREALLGNANEARRRANLAMGRSTGRDVQYGSALALAYAGDDGRAQALADDLGKRFPEDTIVQFNYLPTLRAKFARQPGKYF